MPAKYVISVRKLTTEEKLVRGEWTQVRTEKEAAQKAGVDGENGVYGYAPDRMKDVTSEEEVYRQVLGDLDLPALVAFINTQMQDLARR